MCVCGAITHARNISARAVAHTTHTQQHAHTKHIHTHTRNTLTGSSTHARINNTHTRSNTHSEVIYIQYCSKFFQNYIIHDFLLHKLRHTRKIFLPPPLHAPRMHTTACTYTRSSKLTHSSTRARAHTHTYAAVAHTYAHTNTRNITGTRTQTYHMRAIWSFQVSFRLKMDISVIKGIKFRLLVR